jgi:uncharacterized protein with gpF-like domain
MSDQVPPAWDGRGTDPWLPTRLAAWYDAAKVEAAMFRSFLEFLREWIRLVRERSRAHRYDPTVVQSVAVAWWDAMNEFGEQQLYPAAVAAYLETTGETRIPLDMAALARARVYQRVNQLRNLPNEVYVMVQNLVDRSVTDGWSIERLAAAIEELFDFTATPRWENRATVVARTEAIGALNGGRNDGFAQVASQLGGPFEKMWIATADTRTRETHRKAEGQRVAIGAAFAVGEAMLAYPGDPAGPPGEVIQCRCTTVLVRPGQTLDMSRRRS